MPPWLDKGSISTAQALDIPPIWLTGCLVLSYLTGAIWPGLVAPFFLAKVLGGALAGGGLLLAVWALAVFRAHQTSVIPHQMPRQMITTGPFAFSRNPIYLGDAMVLAGATIWWGHWVALALVPAFVLLIQRRFIAPEEHRLKESFGPKFDVYQQQTRRWL